jgi:hypothetical protein
LAAAVAFALLGLERPFCGLLLLLDEQPAAELVEGPASSTKSVIRRLPPPLNNSFVIGK